MAPILVIIAIIAIIVCIYVFVLKKREEYIRKSFPLTYAKYIPRHQLFDKDEFILWKKREWWDNQENHLIVSKISDLKGQYPIGWKLICAQYPSCTEMDLVQYEKDICAKENRIRIGIQQLKRECPNGWELVSAQHSQSSDFDLLNNYAEEIKQEELNIKIQDLKDRYPDGWDIIVRKYPTYSNEQLIECEDKIKDADILYKKEETIKSDLSELQNACQNCKIEEANRIADRLQEVISKSPIVDTELQKQVQSCIDAFSENYNDGIVDLYTDLFVDYEVPETFVQSLDWKYAVSKFPKKGTHIFPHRRRKIARRGYKEEEFQRYLSKCLSNSRLSILGDCALLPYDGYRPYEPDIAIIDTENYSIRIDIEIDEPYAAITNKPTHYIGCGDDMRDRQLNNLGWIVVRFTEYQVHRDPLGCTSYLVQLICALNPNKVLPSNLLNGKLPMPQERWTEITAQQLAIEKYREQYLSHSFGNTPDTLITQTAITQTVEEKENAKKIQPIIISPKPQSYSSKIDSNSRDRDIQFISNEHIYLYRGGMEFTPVSTLISHFFPFDSLSLSANTAKKTGEPQEKVLEDWDARGSLAREVGTFMHQQIANYYVGKPFNTKYSFSYNGKYITQQVNVDISNEHQQFCDFLKDHSFKPSKIEWTIYDEELQIAGTIDMLCTKGNTFDIYDWKRSGKIIDINTEQPIINNIWRNGISGLENIPDTLYWHYCIQQNLYRYILEQKYGLTIGNMYLVVFPPNAQKFYKLEVPEMPRTIQTILSQLPYND